ncbi:MAG: ImmA/IrrE family metallo-endopeptidase, partial [Limisphaerales bacterium]
MKNHQISKIREHANQLLQQFGIQSAPVNVEGIAGSLGIVIRRTPTDDEVSGFLFKQQTGPTVIGVNSLHHPNRQRFTIAHELGHFMLHDFSEVHVDQAVMRLRSSASSTGIDSDEVEANRFAAELLMPEAFLQEEIERLGV